MTCISDFFTSLSIRFNHNNLKNGSHVWPSGVDQSGRAWPEKFENLWISPIKDSAGNSNRHFQSLNIPKIHTFCSAPFMLV